MARRLKRVFNLTRIIITLDICPVSYDSTGCSIFAFGKKRE